MKWKVFYRLGWIIAIISGIPVFLKGFSELSELRGYCEAGAVIGVIIYIAAGRLEIREINILIRAIAVKIIALDPRKTVNLNKVHFIMIGQESGADKIKLVVSSRAGGWSREKGFFLFTTEETTLPSGLIVLTMFSRNITGREFRRHLQGLAARTNDIWVEYSDDPSMEWCPAAGTLKDLNLSEA